MKIVIGDIEIIADRYEAIPEENAVIFYRDKSDLPPIKVAGELLSDFGKEVIFGGNTDDNR